MRKTDLIPLKSSPPGISVFGDLRAVIGLVWIFLITASNIDLTQGRYMKSRIQFYPMVKRRSSVFIAKIAIHGLFAQRI